MKLLTLNVGSHIFCDTAKDLSTGGDREVLFIDWIPTSEAGRDVVMHQVEIVKSTPSDVQMVVFDRYSSLTPDEEEFFTDRMAILLEPVAQPRRGFKFMPYWVDVIDLPLSTWDNERFFDFGYIGKTLPLSVEVAMLRALKNIPSMKIGLNVGEPMTRGKYQALTELMDVGGHHTSRFNSTLLTFEPEDCYNGRLPDIRKHLASGTVPMMHHENRWFHSLFGEFIMRDHHNINWYSKMRSLNYGFMEQLYKNMRLYMPEMITENYVKEIIGMVK